jgi:hypothetical protein
MVIISKNTTTVWTWANEGNNEQQTIVLDSVFCFVDSMFIHVYQ